MEKLSSDEKDSIMKNDFNANKTFIIPKNFISMDDKGYEKLMTFIIALYIAKKKKDAVCRINCALCSPTEKGRILGSFGHKVCKNIHQKIFIKNIHRDFFYYIGKKHHDDASNQAFELSQSLSHQIIIFDIKPMAPLSN